MFIEFHGAAREVTGSCHIITAGTDRVALDCGLFQGRRHESKEKNAELPEDLDRLTSVVLSHAHIDHSGRLPYLAASGFEGPIWCTSATRDLCALMLIDSAHIQENDAEFLSRRKKEFIAPLYTVDEAVNAVERMNSVPYRREFPAAKNIRARFIDAGHILGSASVVLDCLEDGVKRRIAFSGDIGRSGMPIIRDPQVPENVDALIMESTYGNRLHADMSNSRAKLAQIVRDTAGRGGRVLIPAFAVGRTQEIIYELHALHRAGEIPSIPIYIDSPLATDVTSVFELHVDIFDRSEVMVRDVPRIFQFPLVKYTRSVEESKALNAANGPMVIISASGMVEAGRILHHLAHGASDPRNTILIVGFQAEHTLGRRIVEKQPHIKVFGDEMPLRAQVEVLNGFSAHADRTELLEWLDAVRDRSPDLKQVFLVHGEPEAQDDLAEAVRSRGLEVDCPTRGTVRTIR